MIYTYIQGELQLFLNVIILEPACIIANSLDGNVLFSEMECVFSDK